MKSILDNAVTDARNNSEFWKTNLKDALDEKVAEFKTQLDTETSSFLDKLQSAIDETHNTVGTWAAEDIAFATVHESEESSNSAFVGFGVLTVIGVAAYAAHLHKQKKEKVPVEEGERLIDQDEEFVMV